MCWLYECVGYQCSSTLWASADYLKAVETYPWRGELHMAKPKAWQRGTSHHGRQETAHTTIGDLHTCICAGPWRAAQQCAATSCAWEMGRECQRAGTRGQARQELVECSVTMVAVRAGRQATSGGGQCRRACRRQRRSA